MPFELAYLHIFWLCRFSLEYQLLLLPLRNPVMVFVTSNVETELKWMLLVRNGKDTGCQERHKHNPGHSRDQNWNWRNKL